MISSAIASVREFNQQSQSPNDASPFTADLVSSFLDTFDKIKAAFRDLFTETKTIAVLLGSIKNTQDHLFEGETFWLRQIAEGNRLISSKISELILQGEEGARRKSIASLQHLEDTRESGYFQARRSSAAPQDRRLHPKQEQPSFFMQILQGFVGGETADIVKGMTKGKIAKTILGRALSWIGAILGLGVFTGIAGGSISAVILGLLLIGLFTGLPALITEAKKRGLEGKAAVSFIITHAINGFSTAVLGAAFYIAQKVFDGVLGIIFDDSGVIAPTIPEISRPPIPELSRPPVPTLCRPPVPELFRPPVEAA